MGAVYFPDSERGFCVVSQVIDDGERQRRDQPGGWPDVYAPTTPPSASGVLGATPDASVINVVQLFQYFFQAFGAACVFWAILRWRGIINGRLNGSPTACGVQFVFGVLLINVVTVASGIESFFNTGG